VIVNGVNKNIYKEIKKVIEMADKIIRVSYDTWNQLKANAFYNCSTIKTIVDDMVNGRRDPKTGKTL